MNRIKDLRIADSISQGELAKMMNCSSMTISRYEREEREIDRETICRLCDIFDCSADYLLCRSDMRKPEISQAERDLLDAYAALPLNIKAIVDAAMQPYMKLHEKSAVS